MSFAVYAASAIVKKACKCGPCDAPSVYQSERSPRALARLAEAARATILRSFSSAIGAARRAPSSRSRSSTFTGLVRCTSDADWERSGSGPGTNRTASTPTRAAISAARVPSSKAHIESTVWTCSVPSRAIRAGHALAAIAGPTASGQASTSSAIPAAGPKRPSSRTTPLLIRSIGAPAYGQRIDRSAQTAGRAKHARPEVDTASGVSAAHRLSWGDLHERVRIARQRACACRGHEHLSAEAPYLPDQHFPPPRVQLGEHVVE